MKMMHASCVMRHDALEDVKALTKILFKSSSIYLILKLSTKAAQPTLTQP